MTPDSYSVDQGETFSCMASTARRGVASASETAIKKARKRKKHAYDWIQS